MRSTLLSLALLAAVAVAGFVPAKASAGYPYGYYGSNYYRPSYYSSAYVAPSYYGAYSYYTPNYYAAPALQSYAVPAYGTYPTVSSYYGAYSYTPGVSYYYSPGYRRGFTAFPAGSFYISP